MHSENQPLHETGDCGRDEAVPTLKKCDPSSSIFWKAAGISAQTFEALMRKEVPIRSLFPELHLSPLPEKLNDVQKRNVRYQRLMDLIEPPLAEDHPSNLMVRRCCDEICDVIGVDPTLFTTVVCQSDAPSAYINLVLRRMTITDGLLVCFGHDEKLVKAVIGHELGHVVLKHYTENDDLLREKVEEKKDISQLYSSFDTFLANQALSYDEEYQADRLSCLALTFAGVAAQSMVDALKKIEEQMKKQIKKQATALQARDHPRQEPSIPFRSLPMAWAVQSHPMTVRRTAALSRLIRNLPLLSQKKIRDDTSASSMQGPHIIDARRRESLIDWPKDARLAFLDDCLMSPITLFDPFLDELIKSAGHEQREKLNLFSASQMYDSYKKLSHAIAFIDLEPEEINTVFGSEDESSAILEQWRDDTALRITSDDISPAVYARAWWGQAICHANDADGSSDLERDIAQYDAKTILALVNGYHLEEYVRADEAASRLNTIVKNHMGPATSGIVGSYLCKRWLQCKADDCPDVVHIRAFLDCLEAYWTTHGYPFPLCLARIAHTLTGLYRQGDHAQKEDVISILSDFREHFMLYANQDVCSMLLCKELKPMLADKKEGDENAKDPFTFKPDAILSVANSALVEKETEEPLHCMTITLENCENHSHFAASGTHIFLTIPTSYDEQQARSCIEEACGAFGAFEEVNRSGLIEYFVQEGLSKVQLIKQNAIMTAPAARTYIESTILPNFQRNVGLTERIREMANDKGNRNTLREGNLVTEAHMLGSDDFEDEYLENVGRGSYSDTHYRALDGNVPFIIELHRLWTLGYGEEYREMLQGGQSLSALKKLCETLPLACAHRDQWIALSLSLNGEHILENIRDVSDVQNCIDAVCDIHFLLELQQSFSNVFLQISASKRLYDLYEKLGEEAFLREIPTDMRDRQAAQLAELPGVSQSPQRNKVLCVLICYSSPSYTRDALLVPLLDDARSWQEKQDIANLSSDPPFGVVGTRSAQNVMVHESLFDGFQELDALDRAETLLFLLKGKKFLSGIDNAFRSEKEAKETNALRWQCILGKKTRKNDRDIGGFMIPKVSHPDALILLQKRTGAPLDLIFRQHNVAVSHREQLEIMTEVLFGQDGILQTEHRNRFLLQVAHRLVCQGAFANSMENTAAIESLLKVILLHCPDDKLPSIFLDMWHLSAQEGQRTLPEIVSTMMQKAGPVFVVAAQYLAHQTNALPLEWTQAFRKCVDENRVFDTTLIDAHISAYLGTNPFADIHEKKGEGSKAVVNRVSTTDGKDCIVKIFHGFIKGELPKDIELLQKIVSHINGNHDMFHTHLPANLPEVVEKKMIRQIDPRSELEGLTRLRSVLSTSLLGVRFATADSYKEYSAHSLVTYGNIDGVPLDKTSRLDAMGHSQEMQQRMRNATGLEVLRQMLQTGIYQSDPNLGNFLATQDGTVHWVDYGSMETLSVEDRALLTGLLKTIIFRGIPVIGKRVGSDRTVSSYLSKLIAHDGTGPSADEKIQQWLGANAGNFSMENIEMLLKEFQDFCARENYLLDPQWISVLGTLGLLKPMLFDCPPGTYTHVLGSTLASR